MSASASSSSPAAPTAHEFDASAQWSDTQRVWATEQTRLRAQLVTEDALGFDWPAEGTAESAGSGSSDSTAAASSASPSTSASAPPLTLVGGVDISFVGESDSDAASGSLSGGSNGVPTPNACAALVVCRWPPAKNGSMQQVYADYQMVSLTEPYIPGFLAFREVPHLLPLLSRLRNHSPHLMPQLLFVDGNGLLHPRGFGLACHLGVLADLPTIGIGKNLHHVDGLDRVSVLARAHASLRRGGSHFPLVGTSGTVWGACVRSTDGAPSPIFVSVGHRVSLESAVRLTHACCQHRVPTPVRLADLGSRECIRQWKIKQAAAAASESAVAEPAANASMTGPAAADAVSSASTSGLRTQGAADQDDDQGAARTLPLAQAAAADVS